MQNKSRNVLQIILTALVALIILSICPWSEWTGGRLKDFNLLGDITVEAPAAAASAACNIDPELAQLTTEQLQDTVAQPEEVVEAEILAPIPNDFEAPQKDGVILFEDYSTDNSGLASLKSKLAEADRRKVRIAMVGDSYIEGDILAQDLRSGLQDIYGGVGVGYVGAFSQFPGFRQSVRQTSNGWDEYEIRKMKRDSLRTILGHYHVATELPNIRFRGSSKPANADAWENTSIIFLAPSDGEIKISNGNGDEQTFQVQSSSELQQVSLNAYSADVKITSSIVGLKVLGIWLEGDQGIVLDDISLRGNSGVSHRYLNHSTTHALRQWIDYDIIILEFGMNALSEGQTDYSAYGKGMVEVINNLKSLYPNADIIMMGVGDRAVKRGTDFITMPSLHAMIASQREAARTTESIFYDTQAAMGGDGAAVDWHKRRLLNSDYVHLNHKGGKALAEIIIESLSTSLQ